MTKNHKLSNCLAEMIPHYNPSPPWSCNHWMLGNEVLTGQNIHSHSAQFSCCLDETGLARISLPNETNIKHQNKWTEATKKKKKKRKEKASDPPNIPPLRPADGLKVEPLRPHAELLPEPPGLSASLTAAEDHFQFACVHRVVNKSRFVATKSIIIMYLMYPSLRASVCCGEKMLNFIFIRLEKWVTVCWGINEKTYLYKTGMTWLLFCFFVFY